VANQEQAGFLLTPAISASIGKWGALTYNEKRNLYQKSDATPIFLLQKQFV
jgi:hypothetical protein